MNRSAAAKDAGELALEYVILVPAMLLLFALIFVFGRIVDVRGVLDASTRDAARIASQAPDYGQAKDAATDAISDGVGNDSSECKRTLTVTVSRNFAPGETLTVTAQCTYPISDAGLPGAPGSLTVQSTFSSIIDPNRTVTQ